MEKTVFISMPVGELETLIIDCVRTCLMYPPTPVNTVKLSKPGKPSSTVNKKEATNG